MRSLNFATLPGIGAIEDPRPENYRAAIKWLREDLRRNLPLGYENRRGPDMRYLHMAALQDTLRRLEWTPARLRLEKARAA